MRKMFAILIATLIVAIAAPSSEARRVWPGHGAGGGALSTVECPAGQAMVGLTGASGLFIDRVQIVCATLNADGTFGPPQPYGDPVGGAGGGQALMNVCPLNAKMFDIGIQLDSESRYLYSINFHCRDQAGNITLRMWHGQNNSYGEGLFRGGGEHRAGVQSCPQEYFTGLRIYFRDYVKAVGTICDQIALPAPPPVAGRSSGPPQPNPNRPGRTGTGGVVAAATDTSGFNFLGTWRLKSSNGGEFNLVMHDNGNGISGEFTHANPQYNGTLVGTFTDGRRQLKFTFEQPALNANGSGEIRVMSQRLFVGNVETTDDPPIKLKWEALRSP